MRIDREKTLSAFDAYVKHYNRKDEKVRLKIEHTYRVGGLCERIAKSLDLMETDTELAWLLGILHDIGRFEQLRQYGTFLDAQSVDHALLGAEILFKQGKIRDFLTDTTEDSLLECAVANHSAYRLPEELDKRTQMFCDILRDADKVDILKVNADFSLEEIYNVSAKELKNSVITKEVMEAFLEEHTVLRSLKKTPVDHLVGHISLIYEMVYPESTKITIEQGYLNKLMNFRSENKETMEQFEIIRKKIHSYLTNKF